MVHHRRYETLRLSYVDSAFPDHLLIGREKQKTSEVMVLRDHSPSSGDCNAEQRALPEMKPIIFREGYETGMTLGDS